MRVTLATALWAVLARAATSEDWNAWQDCSSGLAAEEVAMKFSRQLSDSWEDTVKDAHQIVYVDNATGQLEINHNATVWDTLSSVNQEVNVIVLFGPSGAGMSTIGSVLGCAMNDADEASTTQFPAHKKVNCFTPGCHKSTLGLWASDPFTYSGPDGTGEQKTYMIIDTQGLDQSLRMLEGLSVKLFNDATVKLLAMLSEVASEFVYVTNFAAANVRQSEYDSLGNTLKSTRENLVRTGEEFASNISAEVNIGSTNKPGMLFVTREGIGKTIVEADSMTFASAVWDSHTYQYFDQRDPVFQTLIFSNFKNHTVQHNGNPEEVGWYYNPVPEMDDRIAGDSQFDWEGNPEPFPLEAGAACRQYNAMSSNEWKCKDENDGPSAPPTFKVMIDNLVKQIYEHAPVRQVTWGELEEAVDLTGTRMKGFLEAGVTEINKAGPVADNELWRLIAEDRCMVDLNNRVRSYYLGKIDEMNYVVQQVQFSPGLFTPAEVNVKRAGINATWNVAATEFDNLIDNFFLSNALLAAVRPSCTSEAQQVFRELDLRAQRLVQNMRYLAERETTTLLMAENARLRVELDAARAEVWRLWLQANLPYFVGLAIVGLVVLYIFTRMFGTACGTCRACIACCDDLTTKDNDHLVVHVGGGTELPGVPRGPYIPGVATAPRSETMGADPVQRIQELEEAVAQLDECIPKK